MTGQLLEQLKADGLCLRCQSKLDYQFDADPDTGFLHDYCLICRPKIKATAKRQFDRKAEKEAGIATLDRLLGITRPSKTVTLNETERAELTVPWHDSEKRDGGFQMLLVKLMGNLCADGTLRLDEEDLERIPRYAFDYHAGGWQARLIAIFARTLGKDLGR